MDAFDKLYQKAITSPNNFRFSELCALAECAGFEFDRKKGSHMIFKHQSIKGLEGIMNFQDHKGQAKPYQIKQLINYIDAHDLRRRP